MRYGAVTTDQRRKGLSSGSGQVKRAAADLASQYCLLLGRASGEPT